MYCPCRDFCPLRRTSYRIRKIGKWPLLGQYTKRYLFQVRLPDQSVRSSPQGDAEMERSQNANQQSYGKYVSDYQFG